ncbi:cobalamin biosynthesis protein [Salipiger mangrovisoli]|uniref:Cobalamin biosynthesis protein n=1 Tax=Salipiger mangrovisoli TaxID=2865933 RepID=A0ABR9X541_9RHOB|nr:cobalamin biosynthesis protein [Salipiger mangrovisoli]MBE9638661.1 cobalamin biosynthesis protein [Salipiger mangrovisoli]
MIAAGFGFRQGAAIDSLRDAYDRARAGRAARLLASAEDKVEAAVFLELAQALELPIRAVPASELAAQDTVTRSPRVRAERGTGSLAEAAALAAAGPGARLLGPRAISSDRMASCALAEGSIP